MYETSILEGSSDFRCTKPKCSNFFEQGVTASWLSRADMISDNINNDEDKIYFKV